MKIFDASTMESIYQAYLEALLAGNSDRCRQMVEALISYKIDIKDLYMGIFQRSLYHVGKMWESNQISVAREHMATTITENLLPLAYPLMFAAPHIGRKAVVACAAKEFHQLGGKMVADILELNGWDSYFMGANTQTSDLISILHEKQPDLLCISLSIRSGLPDLLSMLERIRTDNPSLPVIVGGQAFRMGGIDQVFAVPGVRYIDSIISLEQMLQEW
jgi:methanogenic corrinoid protein MtbC1